MILHLAASLLLTQAAALDPEGVYIDPDGVLRTREVETGKRLRDLRDAAKKEKPGAELAFVSLPRLFAEAKRKIDAGESIPDEMRTLKGMVKLQYVFVFPDDGDLVIAGPAEPLAADFPDRPVGRWSGRPMLQLDDLVTALRTCGPAKTGEAFGCTIMLTPEITERMQAAIEENTEAIKSEPKKRREICERIGEAGGLQPVAFYGIAPETRFAYVCLEADYLLKRHATGLDKSPVAAAKSQLDLMTGPQTQIHRYWFESYYEPLRVSEDGLAFELRGQSLQVKTRKSFKEEGEDEPDGVAQKYGESTTKHLPKLSEHYLAWADLANVSDLGVLAALIGRDALHEKVGWDLRWVLDAYPVAKVAVPENAQTLVNFRTTQTHVLLTCGGVKLVPGEYVEKRETGAVEIEAHRPNGYWGTTRSK